MATQDIKDLLASATALDLTDTYLVIDTIQDAYTRTYAGGHPYIVKAVGGEYQVYPVKANAAHTALVQEDYPIIFTDGTEVFYTARTTIDPYNFAYPQDQAIPVETSKLVVTHIPTASGNVTLTLNGVATTVAVLDTDATVAAVATKIRETAITGYVLSGTGAEVIITSTTPGVKTDATFGVAATGVTGTITTFVQGLDIERAVLKAFLAFVADEFQFGGSAPYQVFLVDGEAIVDGDTTVTP